MPHCEYSTKPILNPLTHVPESLHDTALLAFLCIMIIADGFPIDKSTVPPLNRLIYILRMGLMNEELRDELYCQLCMQINMNSKESLPAYWRLMTIYMQYFPPSRTFEKFLMDFCSKHAPADKRGRLVAMLMTSIERGPRRNVPTLAEIVSLLKGEKKTVVVKLADDSRLPFVIGPFTTWGDVLSLAMGSFRASSYSGWAFFGEGRLHSLNLGHHVLDSDPACTGKMFTSGLAELPKTVTLRKELMEPAEPIKETRLVELIWAQVMAHVKTTALRCPQALAAQFAAPLAKIHDKQPSEAL